MDHHNSFSRSPIPGKPGLFGAPPCRLTAITIALSAALIGLVLLGVGAAIAGFQWQESFARIIGLLLIVSGGVMMIVGVGIFAYDNMNPGKLVSRMPYANPDRYAYEPASNTTSVSALNVQSLGAQEISRNRQVDGPDSNSRAEAPPPYDAVLDDTADVGKTHVKPTASTHAKSSLQPPASNVAATAEIPSPRQQGQDGAVSARSQQQQQQPSANCTASKPAAQVATVVPTTATNTLPQQQYLIQKQPVANPLLVQYPGGAGSGMGGGMMFVASQPQQQQQYIVASQPYLQQPQQKFVVLQAPSVGVVPQTHAVYRAPVAAATMTYPAPSLAGRPVVLSEGDCTTQV